MQKLIPLSAFALLLSLTACGGNGGGVTSQTLNVTGTWSGSLQSVSGGGLGGVEITLTQSAPPATDFKGTLTTPMFGGNHPLVGDAAKGTLQSDTSVPGFNKDVALTCTGTFTNTSYRGDCKVGSANTSIVLVMAKK